MTSVKVGERFQIVIPRRERRKVRIKPHSRVQVEAKDGYLVIHPVTNKGLRGIGKAIAGGKDASAYIKKLRREWKDRT